MAAVMPYLPEARSFVHRFADNISGHNVFGSNYSGHSPNFDVSESDDAYFLDGAFPGIADKADIHLEWTGKRTLLVKAAIPKMDYEREWGIKIGQMHRVKREIKNGPAFGINDDGMEENGNSEAPNGHSLHRWSHSHSTLNGSGVRDWLSERHVGRLERTFTFPEDVETSTVQARLNQGLLKVMIKKAEPTERQKITVTE